MPKAAFSLNPDPLDSLRPDLRDIVELFQSFLYMPDPGHIIVSLATYAAFLQCDDARLWMLIVGGPSTGKSEGVNALIECPHIYEASTLSVAALASGTGKKDRAKDATGGLLFEMGSRGFVVLKDLTSMLTMGREAKQATFSALREIYDGRWTRPIGSDGARRIAWEGHVGLLAGVTTEIDTHFELNNKLGERFLYYRLSTLTAEESKSQAAAALRANGDLYVLRHLTAEFFCGLSPAKRPVACKPLEEKFLVALSSLVVRCRSSVDRDPKSREIERIHEAEAPARLIQQLKVLLLGLKAIGVLAPYCYQLVRKIAMDSMPPTRQKVLSALAGRRCSATIQDLTEALSIPETMIRRALEELKAHGVVGSTRKPNTKADIWELLPVWRRTWSESQVVPEMLLEDSPSPRLGIVVPDLSDNAWHHSRKTIA